MIYRLVTCTVCDWPMSVTGVWDLDASTWRMHFLSHIRAGEVLVCDE